MRNLVLILASCAALASTSSAQCPQASTDFAPAGLSHPPTDFQVFDDGSGAALYACGSFTAAGNSVARGVARFDAAGWHAVGAGIDFVSYDVVSAPNIYVDHPPAVLAALDDGSGMHLYAAGSSPGPTLQAFALPQYVARWNGMQWTALGGTLPRDYPTQAVYVSALAMFDSGTGPELYAGGSCIAIEDNQVPYLARFDGVAWTRITAGPNLPPCDPWQDPQCPNSSGIQTLTVFDDGTGAALWAGGDFVHVGGSPGTDLARFDGLTWSAPLGTSFTDGISRLVVHDDGTGPALYVGGPTGLRRWTGSGLVGAGFSAPVIDLESVTPAQGGSFAGLWAVVQFSSSEAKAWRFDGATWTQTPATFDAHTRAKVLAVFDDGAGPALYVGGDFHAVDGIAAEYVARHDGNAWSAVGSGNGLASEFGRPGRVSATAVWNNGSGDALYAGGELAWQNGAPVTGLVRWSGSGWANVPGINPPAYASYVSKLLVADLGQGPDLWMAGVIRTSPQLTAAFARLTPTSIVPMANSSAEVGVDLAVFDDGSGPRMYVTHGHTVGRYNDAAYELIGIANASGPGQINALCAFDAGTGPALYAGGRFTSIAGVAATSFARFDGQAWSAVPAGIGGVGNWTGIQVLRVLDLGSGPRLYAGGTFTIAGSTAVSNLAVFDGQTWADVGGGVTGPDARILEIEAFDDGRGDGKVLYVGGNFTSAGGVPVHNLARFDGSTWTDVGTDGGIPAVRALEAIDLPAFGGRALAVGGDFDAVAGVPAVRFGVLRACNEVGATYCHGDVGACPCGNTSPAGARAGCANSFGIGAALRARGTPSVAADTLVLEVTGMSPTQHSPTFFQGTVATNGGLGTPFGDGLRCAGGVQIRIGSIPSSGGAAAFGSTVPGTSSVALRGGILNAGVVRHYQVLYRNSLPFCTSATFNLSNGVTIQWGQ